jgi:hypothetical protein
LSGESRESARLALLEDAREQATDMQLLTARGVETESNLDRTFLEGVQRRNANLSGAH